MSTGYGLDGPALVPGRGTNFSFQFCVHVGCVLFQPTFQRILCSHFWDLKRDACHLLRLLLRFRVHGALPPFPQSSSWHEIQTRCLHCLRSCSKLRALLVNFSSFSVFLLTFYYFPVQVWHNCLYHTACLYFTTVHGK